MFTNIGIVFRKLLEELKDANKVDIQYFYFERLIHGRWWIVQKGKYPSALIDSSFNVQIKYN